MGLCCLAVSTHPLVTRYCTFSFWYRWLFFIEGTITVLVAIAAIFILPDFPETSSWWLTPIEQALALRRMAEDAGEKGEFDNESGSSSIDGTKCGLERKHTVGLSLALNDWKVWWLALTLTCMVVSLSFNAYFPTLSATMGYNTTLTLLLCAPPWIFATLVALWVSRYVSWLLKCNAGPKSTLGTLTRLEKGVGMLSFL